ncbi:hypothetical protein CC2G_002583 [Coprinopsis cinerea AmutBmut pab1-1]|nr:hypothetical protein CC2G_002583 [Coprinopsis cinerea AmutBmut pab1-1]
MSLSELLDHVPPPTGQEPALTAPLKTPRVCRTCKAPKKGHPVRCPQLEDLWVSDTPPSTTVSTKKSISMRSPSIFTRHKKGTKFRRISATGTPNVASSVSTAFSAPRSIDVELLSQLLEACSSASPSRETGVETTNTIPVPATSSGNGSRGTAMVWKVSFVLLSIVWFILKQLLSALFSALVTIYILILIDDSRQTDKQLRFP